MNAPKITSSRYVVPILERALIVLETLAQQPQGMGTSELARVLGMPKNSVFRILTTLHLSGYLQRDDDGKTYRLSRKVLALGYAALDEHNLVESSLGIMRELRDQTEETALLGTLMNGEGVVLEVVSSRQPIRFLVEVGCRFPLHTAAPAKAMLAFLPESEKAALVSRIDFRRYTDWTITSAAEFSNELDTVREQGWAADQQEQFESLHCVAAPIFNHRGHPIAALWVTGPTFRFKQQDFPRLGEKVCQAAARISARFGHNLLPS